MAQTRIVDDVTRPAAPPVRHGVAVEFSIDGDLRFLSHHNTMVMIERCVVRARLPISYTNGFNPSPRIALPLPRPVGVASDADLAWMQLREYVAAPDIAARLSQAAPDGCRVRRVATPDTVRSPRARSATYETRMDGVAVARTEMRLRRFLSIGRVLIRRDYGPNKPLRDVDIRPYVAELTVEGRALRMRLSMTEQGSARPGEVLEELGLAAEEYISRTRRTRVEWNGDLFGGA